MGLSLKPSTYLQGVGLQGRCTITDAFYHSFDFNGKAKAQPSLCIKVSDESGREKEQNYPAGSFVAIAPSLDGETPHLTDGGEFLPGPKLCAQKENVTALFADSDNAFFWEHVVNAGFPEGDIEDDARVLIGTVAEFGPAPKKYIDQAGTEKTRTVAVPLTIVKLPKENSEVAKGVSKSPASSTTATVGANGVQPLAEEAVLKVLEKAGGSVPLADLSKQVFTQLVSLDTKTRLAVRNEAIKPDFLTALAEQGKLAFDGTTISAAA